jgi:hypothetical protein
MDESEVNDSHIGLFFAKPGGKRLLGRPNIILK